MIDMQRFRAAAMAAVVMMAAGCGGAKSAVETSAAPSPDAPAPVVMAGGVSPACPARDASKPDRRPTVAVMYFDNGALSGKADYAPLSKGIADMLVVSMRSNCRIRVVEREQLQKLLAEQNIPADRVDAATRVRIGRLLGAKHMIMGAFVVDLRDQMAISASSVDVETSEHEADVIQRGAAKNLLDLVPALAKKLNDAMQLPPMASAPVFEGARPAKRDDELLALRLYSRALEEQDRGNTPRATELYRASLDKFPAYGPAQAALRKLQKGS